MQPSLHKKWMRFPASWSDIPGINSHDSFKILPTNLPWVVKGFLASRTNHVQAGGLKPGLQGHHLVRGTGRDGLFLGCRRSILISARIGRRTMTMCGNVITRVRVGHHKMRCVATVRRTGESVNHCVNLGTCCLEYCSCWRKQASKQRRCFCRMLPGYNITLKMEIYFVFLILFRQNRFVRRRLKSILFVQYCCCCGKPEVKVIVIYLWL